jgi:hypothetical protein
MIAGRTGRVEREKRGEKRVGEKRVEKREKRVGKNGRKRVSLN